MICNTVSQFKHYICTGYGISSKFYGGKYERLAGIGQGNMLSGAVCRDQSCLVFKALERLKKGVEIILPITLKRIRRTVIAYVDDADFFLIEKIALLKFMKLLNYMSSYIKQLVQRYRKRK